MARMRNDTDRAMLLNSLLNQEGSDAQDAGEIPPRNDMMPVPQQAPAGSTNPAREDEQDMINSRMGQPPAVGPSMTPQQNDAPIPQQLQPVPGQPGMVAVPQQVVASIMQQLMAQGSSKAIGQSAGADGSNRPPPMPDDEEEG